MKRIIIISFAIICLFIAPACDVTNPTGNCVASAIDITTIDDSQVPRDIKSKLFTPGNTYWIHKTDPRFNKDGKLLIIPVAFKGLPRNSSVTDARIIKDFFESGGLGNDNLTTYFEANSYGQFKLTNAGIAPTVSLPNDSSYYRKTNNPFSNGGDWTGNTVIAQEICQLAKVDWKALDANRDNRITQNEVVIVCLFSDGGLGANRPRSFSIQTPTGSYQIDNPFCFLSCKSDTQNDKSVDPVSYNFVTIRHELMHAFFNLPDRYIPSLGKTGNYDPMSAERPRWTNMNIVDKIKIGWVTPKILTDRQLNPNAPLGPHTYSFPNSASLPAALILYDMRYPDECWVIENRCHDCKVLANFDSGLPESGLAVWWVHLLSGKVILISASTPGLKPEEYGETASGALYSFPKVKPGEFIFLSPAEGVPAFSFRKLSKPGSVVCAEFNQ